MMGIRAVENGDDGAGVENGQSHSSRSSSRAPAGKTPVSVAA
jgi:hypothetical protein